MFDTLYICPDFISLEILKTQESNANKTPKVPSNGNSNALGPFYAILFGHFFNTGYQK
jgi:hypothetical protein